MTARNARTATALAVVLAGFALLIALLIPADAGAMVERPAPAETVEVVEPADPFLVALAPATEFAPEHAAALLAAADRVCEGVTAEVPVVDMADALAADLALTDEEARTFVNVAATVHCSPGT